MALRPHLRRTRRAPEAPPAAPQAPPPARPAQQLRAEQPVRGERLAPEHSPTGGRVPAVHRIGAVVVAAVIAVFGILGFADGLDFFSTEGERVLGLSSNGLLSAISVVTAAVLIAAAVRGPRIASTVMIVVGVLFLVSALANLAVLNTDLNVLAFRFPNVVFSVVAGLVLLVLGAYGRVSGNLPLDSPYARPSGDEDAADDEVDENPSTPEEFAAERAMREAEVAVVQHTATPDQQRRVEAMASAHSRAERRRLWLSFDRRAS
ncbi:DUF4383 domain-containing protein [Blastococcus sp. BMG 814]|uniref:DUF4383 domain-containing protein n=1 Tax=Blastococcus carthaginiensis TaxID=3050034 RepID=A0ABT9I811_9ACTN|nr:DUF4383 domain-containing protein [Blastococcus carthaginiensis]MDP5181717.1 DUF4383 domain-containing protein [Blastococcus carthaginiensis]